MLRPRRSGGLMSASTIWPVVRMNAGAGAGDDPRRIEFRKAGRLRAPEASRSPRRARRWRARPPAQPIRKLSPGDGHRKPRKTVNRDGETDGCRGDAERARIKRQRRHHRAETQAGSQRRAHTSREEFCARSSRCCIRSLWRRRAFKSRFGGARQTLAGQEGSRWNRASFMAAKDSCCDRPHQSADLRTRSPPAWLIREI